MFDPCVLTWQDISLYHSDLQLLSDSCCWLNDAHLHLYLHHLLHAHTAHQVLAPALVQWTRDSSDPTILFSLFSTVDYVWMPLNNRVATAMQGGSHWSLCIVDVHQKLLVHFDSCPHLNQRVAADLMDLFHRFGVNEAVEEGHAKWRLIETFNEWPRQQNGFDCGAFVLAAADILMSRWQTEGEWLRGGGWYRSPSQKEVEWMLKRVNEKRSDLIQLIGKLRKEGESIA